MYDAPNIIAKIKLAHTTTMITLNNKYYESTQRIISSLTDSSFLHPFHYNNVFLGYLLVRKNKYLLFLKFG